MLGKKDINVDIGEDCGTPSGLPVDSPFLESPFGEPIEITAFELIVFHGFHKSYSQGPTDTQQTPSRLLTDLNQVLIWRPHLGIFFGDLNCRPFLESSFGEVFWSNHFDLPTYS